jgi:hypothetical protein
MIYRLVLFFHHVNLSFQTITFPLGPNDVKQIDIVNERDVNQIEQKGQNEFVPKEFYNQSLHVSNFN